MSKERETVEPVDPCDLLEAEECEVELAELERSVDRLGAEIARLVGKVGEGA